jgi:hypothetical protein
MTFNEWIMTRGSNLNAREEMNDEGSILLPPGSSMAEIRHGKRPLH